MTGKTHAIVGANAVWIAVLLHAPIDLSLVLICFGGVFGALLPDIDARHAKIHNMGGGAFRNVFRHRHFFHSILALILFSIAATAVLRPYHPLLPVAIALGYVSHIIIDGWNHAGVRYLFPLRPMLHLLPKPLRSKNGGAIDQLLFVAGAFGILTFLLTQLNTPSFTPSF